MTDLTRRLAKLESTAFVGTPLPARRFVMQGPHSLGTEDVVAFLRDQGHAVEDGHLNVIRVVVGAQDGRSVDRPLADLTARAGPADVADAALHLQPSRD